MKSSIISLALVAGLAAAQSDLPKCAQACLTPYITGDSKIAGCGQLEVKCICSNTDFLNGISCCLADCSASDQKAAIAYAQQLCSSAGVTVPDSLSCDESSSASASASASASKSASAASKSASASASASEESASASKTAASESAASKSASKESASASASAAATGSETNSAASGTTEAAATTGTESSSASTSTSTGAAVVGIDSTGGLLGAVMALFLAL